jgi:hypothetical protein
MIRLNPVAEPTWIDVAEGVTLKCDPIGAMVIAQANASPEVQRAIAAEAGPEAVFMAATIAAARLVVTDWDGVGDASGEPVKATPQNVAALLKQDAAVRGAFQTLVFIPALTLLTEKKASAPLPSGSTAGALDTANRATRRAKSARK